MQMLTAYIGKTLAHYLIKKKLVNIVEINTINFVSFTRNFSQATGFVE
jgi:hypothetical protein